MMKILMLQDKPVLEDNRVFREAASLAAAGHKVVLVEPCSSISPESETINGFNVDRIIPIEFFTFIKSALRKKIARHIAGKYEFDVLHCHDQHMLNLGVLIKKILKGKILIYDSHELFYGYPLQLANNSNMWLRLKSRLVRSAEVRREKRNASHAGFIITVNQSLSTLLAARFKPRRPIAVLRNICTAQRKEENTHLHFREKFEIPSAQRILVFLAMHLFRRTLDIESIVEQLANRKEVCLLFICKESEDKNHFRMQARNNGWHNIYFHDFLAYDHIRPALLECDIGLVPSWNKSDLSYWLALDNKIFEYVQAGIPMLLTQQPEYERITNQYQFGICVNPEIPDAYYHGVLQVLDNYQTLKENTVKAASALKWETEQEKLIALYERIKQA